MENNNINPPEEHSEEQFQEHEIIHNNDSVIIIDPDSDKSSDAGFSKKFKRHHKDKFKNESPYITKKFFAICMIIAVFCSAAIGALVSVLLSGTNSFGAYDNLATSSLEEATGSKLTIQEIVAKNANSVVEITTETANTGVFGQATVSEGAGSGVIVHEDGYIVTNNHVIENAQSITVTLYNGNELSAALVGNDKDNDIAVLKIAGSDYDAVEIGDSAKLSVGDLAVAIGNPLGTLGGSATQGVISSLERRLTINDTTLSLLQTDAAINPGNSGGGLFNGAGELVGIVVAKSTGTGIEGLAFAIPISNVASIIDDLIDNGTVSSKPAIGVTVYDITSETAAYYKQAEGVYISEVAGATAKEAGLKAGDRIISIDGDDVASSSDLISRVREHKVGSEVTLEVERDGQTITIKTALEESVTTK
ncbi:MAG: PDZ domain-containing protein [Clostridiales bacterium]|jgi:serine protease Do|nr:PDZ domain-containing protein [Clostridiales bacterium]